MALLKGVLFYLALMFFVLCDLFYAFIGFVGLSAANLPIHASYRTSLTLGSVLLLCMPVGAGVATLLLRKRRNISMFVQIAIFTVGLLSMLIIMDTVTP